MPLFEYTRESGALVLVPGYQGGYRVLVDIVNEMNYVNGNHNGESTMSKAAIDPFDIFELWAEGATAAKGITVQCEDEDAAQKLRGMMYRARQRENERMGGEHAMAVSRGAVGMEVPPPKTGWEHLTIRVKGKALKVFPQTKASLGIVKIERI